MKSTSGRITLIREFQNGSNCCPKETKKTIFINEITHLGMREVVDVNGGGWVDRSIISQYRIRQTMNVSFQEI
jgi:hypothetical protein